MSEEQWQEIKEVWGSFFPEPIDHLRESCARLCETYNIDPLNCSEEKILYLVNEAKMTTLLNIW